MLFRGLTIMPSSATNTLQSNPLQQNVSVPTTPLLSTKPSLLDLPPELRQMIYSHLFADVEIRIQRIQRRGQVHQFTGMYVAFRQPQDSLSILRTCKKIYHEAICVFERHAYSLSIHDNVSTYSSDFQVFVCRMPARWKANIELIECRDGNFIPYIVDEFPKLQQVYTRLLLWHVDERKKPNEQTVATRLLNMIHNQGWFSVYTRPKANEIQRVNERGVRVLMTVWYLNDRRKISNGWEAEIDMYNQDVFDIKKAQFSKIPYPQPSPGSSALSPRELTRARQEWKRNPENWILEKYE